MNSNVLVLNASYEPINICMARRAVVLVLKGVAICEEASPHYLHSPTRKIPIPSVIRLRHYIKVPRIREKRPTKKNVLIRDRNACQYCGKKASPSELTLDHITPRSRGGKTRWENLVACCRRCNSRKGDQAMTDAGMSLLKRPREPVHPFQLHLFRARGNVRKRWRKYLYYS